MWEATIPAPPIKFFVSNSFTTTTGASALIPIASQAAYWSTMVSPITTIFDELQALIELRSFSFVKLFLLHAFTNSSFLLFEICSPEFKSNSVEAYCISP